MEWKALRHNHWAHLALCLVPLAILAVGVYGLGWSRSYLIWGFVVLCPLMHLLMMKDTHGHKGEAPKAEDSKGGGCH